MSDNDFACLKDETYYLGEDLDELAYDVAYEIASKLRSNDFLNQCEQCMLTNSLWTQLMTKEVAAYARPVKRITLPTTPGWEVKEWECTSMTTVLKVVNSLLVVRLP